jgi:hypothetical protein
MTKIRDIIDGQQASSIDYDVTLLEFHIDLDLPGFEDIGEDGEETGIRVPYIVTIAERFWGYFVYPSQFCGRRRISAARFNTLCIISSCRGLGSTA